MGERCAGTEPCPYDAACCPNHRGAEEPRPGHPTPGHTCDPSIVGSYDLRCAGCVALRIATEGALVEVAPRSDPRIDWRDLATNAYLGWLEGDDILGPMQALAAAIKGAPSRSDYPGPNDQSIDEGALIRAFWFDWYGWEPGEGDFEEVEKVRKLIRSIRRRRPEKPDPLDYVCSFCEEHGPKPQTGVQWPETALPRAPTVWADEATPFTGPEVKVLLDENEALRKALRRIAEPGSTGVTVIAREALAALTGGEEGG